MFLGIGAMENNYMAFVDDWEHTRWKDRAERGDIVVRRRGRRVLVWNYSRGVWQITRETLRRVHDMYRRDRTDYDALPERLRPPRDLDLDRFDDAVLTTYAGLLLRNLLDHLHGDLDRAVGACNGGIGRPNLKCTQAASRVSPAMRERSWSGARRRWRSRQPRAWRSRPTFFGDCRACSSGFDGELRPN